VGIQPQLLWSVSFQLSFLAMAGLILLYPYLQAWGRKGIARLFRNSERIVPAAGIVTDGLRQVWLLPWRCAADSLQLRNNLSCRPASDLLFSACPVIYHSHISVGRLRGTPCFNSLLKYWAGWPGFFSAISLS